MKTIQHSTSEDTRQFFRETVTRSTTCAGWLFCLSAVRSVRQRRCRWQCGAQSQSQDGDFALWARWVGEARRSSAALVVSVFLRLSLPSAHRLAKQSEAFRAGPITACAAEQTQRGRESFV